MTDQLNNVQEGQEFHLADGRILRNLSDLKECLNNIDNDLFSHHANSSRNDFENWVRNSIGDVILADILSKIKKPDEMFKAIHDRIDELKKSKPFKLHTKKKHIEESSHAALSEVQENANPKKNLAEKLVNLNQSDYWNGIIDFALGVAVGFAIALLVKSLV